MNHPVILHVLLNNQTKRKLEILKNQEVFYMKIESCLTVVCLHTNWGWDTEIILELGAFLGGWVGVMMFLDPLYISGQE